MRATSFQYDRIAARGAVSCRTAVMVLFVQWVTFLSSPSNWWSLWPRWFAQVTYVRSPRTPPMLRHPLLVAVLRPVQDAGISRYRDDFRPRRRAAIDCSIPRGCLRYWPLSRGRRQSTCRRHVAAKGRQLPVGPTRRCHATRPGHKGPSDALKYRVVERQVTA